MKKKHSILIKTLVALAGISITLLVLLATPLWGTVILLTLLSALCCVELCHATGAIDIPWLKIFAAVVAALIPWLWYFDLQSILLPAAALLTLTVSFLAYAKRGGEYAFEKIAFLFLACIVFPCFFSLLYPISEADNGSGLMLIPLIASWSADTGAQFMGKAFGKHKLAPSISPNKTVEGFIGGLVFGVIGMGIYALVLYFMSKPVRLVSLLVFGLLGALFGTAGDLFFSYVKREYKIKDFGSLMPEHGGIMDRFDSSLFVIPLLYVYMQFFPVN